MGKRASGIYTVTLQDAIGRQSSVDFSVIRDTTPPTLTLEAVVQSDVLVTWSATDSGSGVDASTCLLEVSEDEGAWQTFSTLCGGEDAIYDGQPGHTYTLRLSASDNVSNAASTEVEALVPYVTKYYYANGQRVAMQKEGVVYYVHSDHLVSTSLTTCGSQDGCDGTPHQGVVARQLYHPYGEVRWSEGTLPTDYGFTGQRLEAGLGLMDYGARFYSPRLGRFVSADSILPNPLSPQDLNRYTYTRNNPLAYIDRDGHQVLPVIIGLVVVGFIAYDYLAHPDIAYAPGPDVDVSALPPSDLPDNDAAICAPCPYVERGQWSTAFVMGAIELTPLDEVPGVNQALRKVLKEGGEEAAKELAERGAKVGREALERAERAGTEIVERAMSQAELEATRRTGLLRGGRPGTHYVSDAVNTSAKRAQQRLGLPVRPEVRVRMEVPKGRFSPPTRVRPFRHPGGGVLPGGGMERAATGNIPIRIIEEWRYR